MLEKFKRNWKHCRKALKPQEWLLRRGSGSGLLMLLALTLTACQTTHSDETSPASGADFCTAAKAIYYSRHDTPPTIAQIREHNAVGLALKCGWLSPKKVSAK